MFLLSLTRYFFLPFSYNFVRIILLHMHLPPPPHPQSLTMKSGANVQSIWIFRIKVLQLCEIRRSRQSIVMMNVGRFWKGQHKHTQIRLILVQPGFSTRRRLRGRRSIFTISRGEKNVSLGWPSIYLKSSSV